MPDTQNTIEGWLQSALINEDQWKVTEESMAFSSLLTHNVRGGCYQFSELQPKKDNGWKYRIQVVSLERAKGNRESGVSKAYI